jgi:basic membrane lipoprotein Med (substrate-binding protein (PBP1-ABC) superfamily)
MMADHCSRRDFLRWSGAGTALALSGVGLRSGPAAAAAGAATLKVGVALVSPAAELGWTKQHTLGAEAIRTALGDKVEINIIDNVFQPQDAERVFRGFAASGHQLVFGTSFSHTVPMARAAPQFPAVAFDCCSGVKLLSNLGGFEARYHEGSYLAGIAAAKTSKTGKLGFVGGYPVPDIVGPANAFLLGAQSVRPTLTCSIIFMNSWEDPGKEKDATLALIAQGCDVLAAMTDSPVAAQTAEQKGIWSIGYASDVRKYAPTRLLTSMILDWSGIYVQDARDVLAGVWKPQARWYGLKEGVVKLTPYLESIGPETRALLARSEAGIKAGTLQPFAGEIKDQAGNVRVRAGTALAENEVRSINWLVAGMQGRLKG